MKRKILSGNTKRFSCRKKLGWIRLDQATAFTILETVATINCTRGNCFNCFTCGLFSSHIKLLQKGSPKGRGRRLIPHWLERRFYEFSHQCLYNSVYSILKLFKQPHCQWWDERTMNLRRIDHLAYPKWTHIVSWPKLLILGMIILQEILMLGI